MAPDNPSQRADKELASLLGELQTFARDLLQKHGGFPPFGGTVDAVGKIGLVIDGRSASHRSGDEQVNAIQNLLRQQAQQEKVNAAGLARMVRVELQPNQPVDAMLMSLHHSSGRLVDVILPFTKAAGGKITYGTPAAQEGSIQLLER